VKLCISISRQNVGKIGKLYTAFCQLSTISRMARTNMLRLKRAQYRGIRIALGLMCSTPNNNMGLFSGLTLLAKRFETRPETRKKLNMGHCIAGYSNVLPLNIVSSESFI
jgi:hypothetical protein